jgi:hypothetical protein
MEDNYCVLCQEPHQMTQSCLQDVHCKKCGEKGHLRKECEVLKMFPKVEVKSEYNESEKSRKFEIKSECYEPEMTPKVEVKSTYNKPETLQNKIEMKSECCESERSPKDEFKSEYVEPEMSPRAEIKSENHPISNPTTESPRNQETGRKRKCSVGKDESQHAVEKSNDVALKPCTHSRGGCAEVFPGKKELHTHAKKCKHKPNSSYACHIDGCNKRYYYKEDYEKHLATAPIHL